MGKTRIICYGVRSNEINFFKALNKKYEYELIFIEDFKIDDKNIKLAKDCNAIMVRENVFLSKKHLTTLKEYGLKYLLTRTAGFDHIDVEAAKELGFHSLQRVPAYSPNAIGELAITLAMTLVRKIQYTSERTKDGDYTISNEMLSREIRQCTVGVLGVGKIGYITATLFKGLGAKIIGYDPYPNDNLRDVVEYVSLEELFERSDVISINCPLSDSTKHIVNKNNLKLVKNNVVIVNTGRGPLVNINDMIDFLKKNPQASYGTDVLEGEEELFFKKYDKNNIPNLLKEIGKLYPQMLITPHVGAITNEALKNTIETSFENLKNALDDRELINNLI